MSTVVLSGAGGVTAEVDPVGAVMMRACLVESELFLGPALCQLVLIRSGERAGRNGFGVAEALVYLGHKLHKHLVSLDETVSRYFIRTTT